MLPVILAGAGLIGGGLYLVLSGKKPSKVVPKQVTTSSAPANLPVGVPVTIPGNYGPVKVVALPPTPGASLVPTGQVLQTGTTPAGNPVVGTVSNQTGSPTSIAANNLHDYLKAHGSDGSPALKGLIQAFQAAGLKDQTNVGFGSSLSPSGVFDLPTSAALTIFLGDPIQPDTQGQQYAVLPFSFVSDVNQPGASVMSGNNLYFYLRLHGNDKSPLLQTLTQQFQHDVNTDPKYPKGHVSGKLTEDGKWGAQTQNALSVYGFAVKV